MKYWFLLLLLVSLMPLTMIFLGKHFQKKPPATINWIYGYRTSMSMKNEDTWVFAHRKIGQLWHRVGLLVFLMAIVVMLFLLSKERATIS